jgi:hypothetical protein
MITKEVLAAAPRSSAAPNSGDALGAVATALASRDSVAIIHLNAIRDAPADAAPGADWREPHAVKESRR